MSDESKEASRNGEGLWDARRSSFSQDWCPMAQYVSDGTVPQPALATISHDVLPGRERFRAMGARRRARCEVVVSKELLVWKTTGKPVTVARAKYVLLAESRRLLVGQLDTMNDRLWGCGPKYYHPSLSGGAPVLAAGRLSIEAGVLYQFDNGSGHYRPKPATLEVFYRDMADKRVAMRFPLIVANYYATLCCVFPRRYGLEAPMKPNQRLQFDKADGHAPVLVEFAPLRTA